MCVFLPLVVVAAAVILLFIGLYSIYIYLYRYKGSYHTNEPKNFLESPGGSSSRPLTGTLEKKRYPAIEEDFRSD
jgi:hypothetical protein